MTHVKDSDFTKSHLIYVPTEFCHDADLCISRAMAEIANAMIELTNKHLPVSDDPTFQLELSMYSSKTAQSQIFASEPFTCSYFTVNSLSRKIRCAFRTCWEKFDDNHPYMKGHKINTLVVVVFLQSNDKLLKPLK